MTKNNPKPALVNLSVEEENLAAIPFAVLERRVGKRIGKIEIKGTKVLPNGSEMEVVWQIQGNNESGPADRARSGYLRGSWCTYFSK